MLAIKIWNYLKGYVIIRIKGLTLERLLNLALSKGVYLWDVNRINNTTIEATVSLVGIDALEEIINKSGCEIDIKKRAGIPFILDRLKGRKMFVAGLALFLCLMLFLSQIIWDIEIIGAEQTPEDEIIKLLNNKDIKIGRLKHRINTDEAEGIILKNYDYLSFLDIRINGVNLIVELKEIDIEPRKVDTSYPCHIIAKRKGVIVKVVAKNGKALVEKGKIVEENDLLISGIIDSEISGETYLVHAEGEVMAQTRYSHIVELPIVKLEKKETGEIYRQWGISTENNGIRFLSRDIPFDNYIEELVEKNIFNLKWIPFKIVSYIYREVEIEEIKQDLDFLKSSAELEAIREINKDLSETGEILSRNTIHTIDGNILRTKVNIDTVEDIGKVKIIN
ncbi:MAG TPA: sporulation protein YqfD [Tissierellaceae bacterium]|nr:sporulation protein YqfD [Tissierellaceae bacterium]